MREAITARIEIVPKGRMANQMFQYMLAHALAERIGDYSIAGHELPQWGLSSLIHSGSDSALRGQPIVLRGHRFPLEKIAKQIKSDPRASAKIIGWGCRLEYFSKLRTRWMEVFQPSNPVPFSRYGDEYLVIHVRGEDILTGKHTAYMPLPLSFIEHVARQTTLKLVFVGQIDASDYCNLLRTRFPRSVFSPNASAISDFQTLRHSSNLLISVSTFSWLASWLSETARVIHFPMLGFFNPYQRPDIDLMPIEDKRYRFYEFPIVRWSGRLEELEKFRFLEIGPFQAYLSRYLTRARNSWLDLRTAIAKTLMSGIR